MPQLEPDWRMPTFLPLPATTPQQPQNLLRPTMMNGLGLGAHVWRPTSMVAPQVGLGAHVWRPTSLVAPQVGLGGLDALKDVNWWVSLGVVSGVSYGVGEIAKNMVSGTKRERNLIGNVAGVFTFLVLVRIKPFGLEL